MSRAPLSREPTQVTIDGFTHGGEGVGRIEGKAVFVPGTIPGEQVLVRVVDDRKRWARARLLEVIETSPDRVTPPCPYLHGEPSLPGPDPAHPAGVCGGCDLQHVAVERQRDLKTRVVIEQLQRLGRVTDPPVAPTRAVGTDWGYRTRARFHADSAGRLGLRQPGSHEVVAVDRCRILAPAAQQVRDAVGDASGAAEVAVHGHGDTGTAAAVVAPGPGGLELPAGDFDLILTQPDGASLPLRGDGVLAADVASVRYHFDTASFFQVSASGAAALVDHVLAAAGDVGGALVWDLYAGVGLFSVPLARRGATVVAVEGHGAAAAWAARNAEQADAGIAAVEVGDDIGAVEVVAEDVGAFVTRAGEADEELPDVVVLDPPRAGAGERVAAALAALDPGVIVYVACDVAALARDTRVLTGRGYRLRSAQPLDLFPQTHHVEVVARFTR